MGYKVTVITTFPNYPTGIVSSNYKGKFFLKEQSEGLRVFRTWIYATPNKGIFKRLLSQLTFAISSLSTYPFIGQQDIVYAEYPPLFSAFSGYIMSKLCRAKYILNVADLWLDFAVELNMIKKQSVFYRIAKIVERFCYRKAIKITTPTLGFINNLNEVEKIPPEKIHLLTNAVDTDFFAPCSETYNWVRSKYGLSKKFVLFYGGMHGPSQALHTLIEAARILEEKPIIFLFVGDGSEKKSLMILAQKYRLENVIFEGIIPKDQMPDFICAADSCIVSLINFPMFQRAVPSKTLEYMACAKPVIASAKGELAELIEKAKCGVITEPGNPVALAKGIEEMASTQIDARILMGLNGRAYIEQHYSRDKYIGEFIKIINA
jgi:glycosyltransferase involved in cell wall biosynthesis